MEVVVVYFKLLTEQTLRQPIMKVQIDEASLSSSDEIIIGE